MFSEELYELDRNTVQYMIDEMQDELNTLNSELNTAQIELDEMNIKYKKSVKNTVKFLRGMNLSDQEIVAKICDLYQFDKEQASEYL